MDQGGMKHIFTTRAAEGIRGSGGKKGEGKQKRLEMGAWECIDAEMKSTAISNALNIYCVHDRFM